MTLPLAASRASERTWLALAAAMFSCAWGGNQFTPLLVMYRQLGYSAQTVNALLAAYVLGLIPGLLTTGRLSDRRGRRPVMLVGATASLLASGLLALGSFGVGWIAAGRALTGYAVAVAMTVGSTWLRELSADAPPGAGARRSAMALTLGFTLGAGAAGALAQWAPAPQCLPYLVHVGLAAVTLLGVRGIPETAGASPVRARLRLRELMRHRRFVVVVVPMAPWIFGSAGIAYAILPQLVESRVHGYALAYSTVMTVATLGAGALIQPVAKRLDSSTSARACVVAMLCMSSGVLLSAVAAAERSPVLALATAVVLGAAYGVAVVSGLQEIQRLADPQDLAAFTGVYFSLAYVGFLVPSVLSALHHVLSYPVMLAGLAAICLAGTVLIGVNSGVELNGAPDAA